MHSWFPLVRPGGEVLGPGRGVTVPSAGWFYKPSLRDDNLLVWEGHLERFPWGQITEQPRRFC